MARLAAIPARIQINYAESATTLACQGDWNFQGIAVLSQDLSPYESLQTQKKAVFLDVSSITDLDSTGAWLIYKLQQQLYERGFQIELQGFQPKQETLFTLVTEHANDLVSTTPRHPRPNPFEVVGRFTMAKFKNAMGLFDFFGHCADTVWRIILLPRRFIFSSYVNTIDEVGFQALPIIAMMAFLVGIVLAYQMGLQLRPYGADIFIVNISGNVMLREFAPLITAIIASGRTASAFTARIGMMKVKEEIDALRCLGLSPIERLVIPRVVGTMTAIPMLVIWANIFGVLGCMVMAKNMLGISFDDFLHRFDQVIELNDYLAGMYKAPTYALIISLVGCYQGFQVATSAESVGWQTTKSVVQSIFLIIVADAVYSVLYNWAGI